MPLGSPRDPHAVALGRCDPEEPGHRWPSIWNMLGGQSCYCGLFTDQTMAEFNRLATLAEAVEAMPVG